MGFLWENDLVRRLVQAWAGAPDLSKRTDIPIDAATSEQMQELLGQTAFDARQLLREKGNVYLSLPLDDLQHAIDTAAMFGPWREHEDQIRKFAQDVIALHRKNAGDQTEVFLGSVTYFSQNGDSITKVGFHNEFGLADPRRMDVQGGLVMEFITQYIDTTWSAEMRLEQRYGQENKALNDRFAALSTFEQVGVAWFFTEVAQIVAERSTSEGE